MPDEPECPHGDWCCQSEPCCGPSDPTKDDSDDTLICQLRRAREQNKRLHDELLSLREELLAALDRPDDPACASDAERDVDYWRIKAADHFAAFMGCNEERRALVAQLRGLTRD